MNRFELLASVFLAPAASAAPAVLGAALMLSGCQPHIGDHCVLNTDCSLQGTRVCDTSQPNGYCTVFNCIPDSCIDKAACVMFSGTVPGCPYDDYKSPARTGRTMCLEQCQRDSDCRQSDGYHCVDPREPPWDGIIVDDVQTQHVCLAPADYYDGGPIASYPDAAVCQSSGPAVPPIEAGVQLEEAGTAPDAGPGGG